LLARADAPGARPGGCEDYPIGSGAHGRIIDSQKDVGGWPVYKSAPPPADSDGDGIPDEWEVAHGLNPRHPSDPSAVDASGYSNIERYINSLAAGSMR